MSDSTVRIGEVIFTSFKPIIKMVAIAFGGGIFARQGVLTPEACRANASIILSFFLPLLIFATVVPSFDTSNMANVGVLALTGVVYMLMGLVFGLAVRWFTPVPPTWKNGVVATGLLGNWGDLIIAYIQTLAKNKPFKPEDTELGIAYASIFMFVQLVVVYNLGGLQLIKRDFDPKPPSDVEKSATADDHLRVSLPQRLLSNARNTLRVPPFSSCANSGRVAHRRSSNASEQSKPTIEAEDVGVTVPAAATSTVDELGGTNTTATSSTLAVASDSGAAALALSKEAGIVRGDDDGPPVSSSSSATVPSSPPSPRTTRQLVWARTKGFLTPPSISVIIAIIIANVPQLKALFVHTNNFSLPDAPDKKPPLDFIMEICRFAGPNVVPVIGLVLLGAAFSRLSIKNLPKGFWKSIVAMAVLKLVVGPIIGIVWTTQLIKHTSLVDANDRMLKFVMVMMAASPTATSTIYITQVFLPVDRHGSVELSALSAILLFQYGLMIITLTTVVSYSMMYIL